MTANRKIAGAGVSATLAGGLAAGALLAAAGAAEANMAACSSAAVKDDPQDQVRLYTLCIEGGISRANRAGAYHNRAVARLQLGEIDAAFDDLTRSIDYDPDFALGYFNRAQIHLRRGALEAAIADLGEAVRKPPARIRAQAYFQRGAAHAQLGQCEQAFADFDESLDYDDDLPRTRVMKALVLATCPDAALRDGAAAVALAGAVLEDGDLSAEDRWRAREAMAAGYAEQGLLEDAAREQQAVIELQARAGVTNPASQGLLEGYSEGGAAYRMP